MLKAAPTQALTPVAVATLAPRLLANAGPIARRRVVEFFTAVLSNDNTREAYRRAVVRFSLWCDGQGLALDDLDPVIAATYIKQLEVDGLSLPTIKQHLAALRTFCDWLVTSRGHVLDFNPFSPVRGPRYSATEGATPVLDSIDARRLLDAIPTDTLIGLRDRAMVCVMLFALMRVSAVCDLRLRDYVAHERMATLCSRRGKGGKRHSIPVHHEAAAALDAYLAVAELEGINKPLFRSMGRDGKPSGRGLDRRNVWERVKHWAKAAGLPPEGVCNHTFRATGITVFRENGGSLEDAAQLAEHVSSSTTRLYDRSRRKVDRREVERIRI